MVHNPHALSDAVGGQKNEVQDDRQGAARMTAANALVVMLPPARSAAEAGNTAHWWRVGDGRVIEQGTQIDWIDTREGGRVPETVERIVAIAPGGDIALQRPDLPQLTPKQRDAVAARTLASDHPAGPGGLNVAPVGDTGLYAVATAAAMDQWSAWCQTRGFRPDSIVPAILLPPTPDDLTFVRLTIAGQNLLRSPLIAFAEEPGITDMLVGDAPVVALGAEASDAALVEAVRQPPAELAIGRWAPRGEPAFAPDTVKRAAALALLALVLTIAIPLAIWAKLSWTTSSLNSDSIAAAEGLINPVPAVDALPAALDARLAALGGDSAKLTPPLAALMQAMEPQATVSLDQVSFQEGGVLSATIGAPRAEDLNAVLVPLQNRGWRITAQPRAGTDGRNLADITVRNGL